ncbi:MAG TPA: class I SAM-dependent rRNA methyltransferase, partial [Chitinispirillaceae bacterium]|nr:class I SAM-dependent rRNA methyltransferase [Chitinispirillaceae bacterium]
HKSFSVSELHKRIISAIDNRKSLISQSNNCCRLINTEGDFLPGLIVDKYGPGLVIQILTAGMERFRQDILKALSDYAKPLFIYERSDTESRTREGLNAAQGLLYGNISEKILLTESGLNFEVDIISGQKTGFFFDQRPNRQLLRSYASGRRICDCFSYSAAFSVNALAADAMQVDSVDISKNAIKWAENNIEINGFDKQKVNFITADVFKFLRETEKKYDLIILDPPKFAKHPGEVQRASRGYKDINLLAIKKIEAGGIIFTFSCSNAIDPYLFRQIVFAAAADAGRPVQILHSLSAGPDHPVNIAHREGEYLKGLVLRVLE